MKEYPYTENTIFHSIQFNISKLESILTYGIVSELNATKINKNLILLGLPTIPYTKNYQGTNTENAISCVSYELLNLSDQNSAYNLYTSKGIGFIIEEPNQIIDKSKYPIHRPDEVWIEGNISLNKIKGIIIPNEYQDKTLNELTYLPLNATKYENIKSNYDMLKQYLKDYHYDISQEEANKYLKNLYILSLLIQTEDKAKESETYKENYQEWKLCLQEFNQFLANNTAICMNRYFGNDITILEMVEFILHKHKINLPIYNLPFENTKINYKK